jgi:hypothetical protein
VDLLVSNPENHSSFLVSELSTPKRTNFFFLDFLKLRGVHNSINSKLRNDL